MATRAPRKIDDRHLPAADQPHETSANGVLRPVVFGGNDGLVSNLALVMGVAGATSEPGVIVLAGIAGLLAGAFSMGVGEYISVQSQRELLEFQIAFQRKQLREAPEQEHGILARIYEERGFQKDQAEAFARAVIDDPEHAVRLLIFEEVGLDERSIGSPISAAIGSFIAFTMGALIPLVPFLVAKGDPAFFGSIAVSMVALAVLGTGIAKLTRRPILYCAVRQMLLGGAAAIVTFGVGRIIGVQTS